MNPCTHCNGSATEPQPDALTQLYDLIEGADVRRDGQRVTLDGRTEYHGVITKAGKPVLRVKVMEA